MKIKLKLTNILLIATVAFYLIYETIVIVTKSWGATWSVAIWRVGYKFLFIPYAAGVLMSHWFAPDLKLYKRFPRSRYYLLGLISVAVLIWSILTVPHAPLHPFIGLLLGMGAGLLWHK